MEGLQKLGLIPLESLVFRMIDPPSSLPEGGAYEAPTRIAGKEDHDIYLTVLPSIFNRLILAGIFKGLHLNPMIVRAV